VAARLWGFKSPGEHFNDGNPSGTVTLGIMGQSRGVAHERPELARIAPLLRRALDCWNLLPQDDGVTDSGGEVSSTRARYLPREAGEPLAAYLPRLARSSYTSTFRDSIRAFAGLLSRVTVTSPTPSLEAALGDVDLRGSSLKRFLGELDALALRDGGALVLVEMPAPDPTVRSAAEERASGRRPYLVPFERSQLINWRTQVTAGRQELSLAVLKMREEMAVDGSEYETAMQDVFLVMRPGEWRKIAVVMDSNGRPQERELGGGPTSLDYIPLIWYGISSSDIGAQEVLMDGLACLTVEHMRTRSDLAELIHRCALPVAVRTGDSPDADGNPRPLILGPNSALDLPTGASFSWVEPGAQSLKAHQEEVAHIERLMKEAALTFLWGEGERTATEAHLAAGHVSSQVAGMMEAKASMFHRVMETWADYMSEDLAEDSALEIRDSMVQRPLGAHEVQQLLALHTNSALSRQSLLEELQRGGVLDADRLVTDELERIAEDGRTAHAAAADTLGGAPDPTDPATFAPQ
jgi:Domain of unknown function (DUF4055)